MITSSDEEALDRSASQRSRGNKGKGNKGKHRVHSHSILLRSLPSYTFCTDCTPCRRHRSLRGRDRGATNGVSGIRWCANAFGWLWRKCVLGGVAKIMGGVAKMCRGCGEYLWGCGENV